MRMSTSAIWRKLSCRKTFFLGATLYTLMTFGAALYEVHIQLNSFPTKLYYTSCVNKREHNNRHKHLQI